MFYIRTADRLQRTAAWLESLEGGLDYLREVIVDDSLGICAELDAAMERHVATYADEWRGHPRGPGEAAPVRLLRQRPGTPDPSIAFEHRTRPDQARAHPRRWSAIAT